MTRNVYFYQACPICGRSLQIRVEYLGRNVYCRHCRGEFQAELIQDQSGTTGAADTTRTSGEHGIVDAPSSPDWGFSQRTSW